MGYTISPHPAAAETDVSGLGVHPTGSTVSQAAVSVTTDTVHKSAAGQVYRIHIIKRAARPAAMTFYDNASAGSGVPLGTIPASCDAGEIWEFPGVKARSGITVKGGAGNPQHSISTS